MGQDNRSGHVWQETAFCGPIQAIAGNLPMRPLLLLLGLLASPVLAQDDSQPDWNVIADLDGDEVPETYRLRDNGEVGVDLSVLAEGPERVVPDIAWTGAMFGTQPELSVNHAGSLLITSMNEAIGRDRWRITLTVAHRDGDLRIAGITYAWYDTLDPTAWGSCDLNLLSGRGELETETGTREVAIAGSAPLLWDWSEMDPPVPFADLCRGAS
jgi:hypothetical protein